MLTEQRNPRSMNLHTLTIAEIVALINHEDEAVVAAVGHALPDLAAFVRAVEPFFVAQPPARSDPITFPGRLIYVGAGTSGRLGVLDASEAPPTFQVPEGRIVGIIAGGDRALRRSSEGAEDQPDGARADLDALRLSIADSVLGIAAGGTTPYVLGALRFARHAGSRTGLLTCAPIPRPPACDHLIVLPTGPEIITGSTRMKAGSATKMALNIISTALMVHSGRVYENLMVDVRARNAKLRDRAARIVSTLTGLAREPALSLLDRARGSVKVAIVMHRLRLSPAAAAQRLARLGDRLDAALA
ncbi:MAG: N-acetylmuramic acid 6-phosphate etherase [Phycisphaerales bacterium]